MQGGVDRGVNARGCSDIEQSSIYLRTKRHSRETGDPAAGGLEAHCEVQSGSPSLGRKEERAGRDRILWNSAS